MPRCLSGKSSATPMRRSTKPPLPNAASGLPVFGSSENRRPSNVPRKIRDDLSSGHQATPRLTNNGTVTSVSIFGSNAQICLPVSGSSAMTRENGVERYITPLTTSGVVSNELWAGNCVPSLTSQVWNSHATFRSFTFETLICFNGEYLVPPASPPYAVHSCEPSKQGAINKSAASTRTTHPVLFTSSPHC